jgi:hypothetical protein
LPGPKSDKIWADAVRRAVNRRLEGKEGNPKKLESLADKVVEAGLSGDMQAIREIGDRLDGKPHQAIDHSSEDGTMSPPTTIELIAVSGEGETPSNE